MSETDFRPDIIPIQIRSDLTVFIQGIPWDLTKAEAEKIVRVVNSLEHVPVKIERK